jgi:uncharacterized membrane protein
MNRIIGIVLIALGIIGLAWGGFTYKTRQHVLDVGPIHATREQSHHVPLSPIMGGVALVGGLALLMTGGKD